MKASPKGLGGALGVLIPVLFCWAGASVEPRATDKPGRIPAELQLRERVDALYAAEAKGDEKAFGRLMEPGLLKRANGAHLSGDDRSLARPSSWTILKVVPELQREGRAFESIVWVHMEILEQEAGAVGPGQDGPRTAGPPRRDMWVYAKGAWYWYVRDFPPPEASAMAPVDEARARRLAADHANEKLQGTRYALTRKKHWTFQALRPEDWSFVRRVGERFLLEIQPPSGFQITVSMKLDGTDIVIERAGVNPL